MVFSNLKSTLCVCFIFFIITNYFYEENHVFLEYEFIENMLTWMVAEEGLIAFYLHSLPQWAFSLFNLSAWFMVTQILGAFFVWDPVDIVTLVMKIYSFFWGESLILFYFSSPHRYHKGVQQCPPTADAVAGQSWWKDYHCPL